MGIVQKIALLFTTDTKQAERDIKKIDQQLSDLDKKARALSEKRRQATERVVERGSDIAGDIISGGGLPSFQNLLFGAGAQGALAYLAVQISERTRALIRNDINDAIAKAAEAVTGATSGAEGAAAILAGAKAGRRKVGYLRNIGDIVTRKTSPFSMENQEEQRRIVRRQFRAIAADDPYYAADILANLPRELQGQHGELQKILDEEIGKQEKAEKGAEYRKGLQPQKPKKETRKGEVVVTNVYTAFDGLGGRNTVGREVRSALDSRDRNNARYITNTGRG